MGGGITAGVVVAALTALGGLSAVMIQRAPARHPAGAMPRAHRRPAPAWIVPLLREASLPDTAWPPLAGAGLVALVALGVVGGPWLPAAVGAGLVAAPRLLGPSLERRRHRRRDEQLPSVLERLAAELRSGRALGPALVGVAEHTGSPLGDELRAMAVEVRHGASATTVLQRWGDAASSAEVRLAASALALGSEAGGQLARSVDDVAATLRERRELRAEARALATQARASAGVLVLAPPAFTLLVSTAEPGTLRFLLGSAPGLACLAGGVALDLIGARWMARIVAGAG